MSDEEEDMSHDDSGEPESPSARPQNQVLSDPDENTLRIMLSTDNHLGYNERDPVRGLDSFAAFEEVLYLAKHFQCDMVLIAGDLFHENKPSRLTLFKCMDIIRRYCMGDNPVRIQILSDAAKNFASGVANYQDPNYSVDLPVFSIHGNHDDPVRELGDDKQTLAALDLLSISNLVNYMGKQDKIDQVEISPVLLKKGTTQLALYGLGSMRDERLNRMWNGRKVRFLRPTEDDEKDEKDDDDEENEDDEKPGWFNIFTLHQNRDLGRGAKNCIQETMIPEWMDLVVWGHEHECLIDFSESIVGTFRITQPGSSVATSLVTGEAARKNVGILDVMGKQFRLHKVPLTQVRSFVTTEVSLRERSDQLDADDPRIDEKVTAFLEQEVRVLALNAKDKRKEVLEEAIAAGSDAGTEDSPLKNKLHEPQQVLVRLRVEHSGFTTLNNQRFGAKFVGRIANPEDILLFHRKKDPKAAAATRASRKSKAAASEPIAPESLAQVDIEQIITKELEANEELQLLSRDALGDALEEFVEKNLTSSMDDAADKMLKKQQKHLLSNKDMADKKNSAEDSLDQDESMEDAEGESSGRRQKKRKAAPRDDSLDDSRDASFRSRAGKENSLMEDDDDSPPPAAAKQRSSRKRRAASEDSDFEDATPAPKSRSSRAAAASSSKAASSSRASAATTKRMAARRQKLNVEPSEEEEDSELEIVEQKKPRAKKTAAAASSSRSAASARRSTRGRKKVVYNVDESDDDGSDGEDEYRGGGDDDDDDLMDDYEDEKPKSRKKKAATARSSRTKAATSRSTTTTNRGTARRAPKSTASSKKRHKFHDESDDSDDVVYPGSSTARLDDDWGSATTRSQL